MAVLSFVCLQVHHHLSFLIGTGEMVSELLQTHCLAVQVTPIHPTSLSVIVMPAVCHPEEADL